MRPTPPPAERLGQIKAAVAARQLPKAIELARAALDEGFEHAQLLHLRSTWHESQGRQQEALADLERAHTLDPAEVAVLMALGSLLVRMGRPMLAKRAFVRASELRPDLPGPLLQVGLVCENSGQVEEARTAYQMLLKTERGHVFALGRLATIAAQQGEWEQARHIAQQALSIEPNEFAANLAYARADVQGGALSEAEVRLNTLLQRQLTPEETHLAQNELGELRRRQGRHPEAFAAWSAGNEAAWRRHAPRWSGAGGAAALLTVLTDHFCSEPPWAAANGPHEDHLTHVFLMGFARSGTTLLEQVLAAHPEVVAMDEKDVLARSVEPFWSSPTGLTTIRDASSEQLDPYRDLYWQEAAAYGFKPDRRVFIDKSPFNALRLPLIARLFPRAKILFALRDPRDVVLSCFRTHFRTNVLTFELLRIGDAGRFYADYMELAHLYLEKLPLEVLPIRHEDLLDDFAGQAEAVCRFIGIDLQPHMLAFETSQRTVATPSAHQLKAGLNRTSVGQWRTYAEQMAPALAHLDPWVRRLGYTP